MSERVSESEFKLDEPEIKKKLETVGIELNPEKRSATFVQVDQDTFNAASFTESVEIMSIRDAMEKYEWVEDYFWKLIKREQDVFTKEADSEDVNGYFIRSLPGKKVEIPVEACLYLRKAGSRQKVHNIIIAEEGSELNIISGCTSHPGVTSGMHIGISEFFVKKNAKLTFTMIHSWESDIEVRPRSAALVEENGVFISNYVLMNPVKLVQMYPTAYVKKNGTAIFSSIIVALENSVVDSGSRAILEEEGASAEIVSRTISKGGDIIARGHIVGSAPDVRGHLECRGLMLDEKGMIHAIPELEARYPNVDLSHEAAIGKIAEEEIFYLQSRGLTRDEATAAIIRGFLELDIKGIPDVLKREIDKAVSMVEGDLF
ncbi:ABC-type transport system involved in Fe-S cluster assembly, permease component [Archaeoglobus sulfaticallidus PM70-1]|uniref:ABC-type transport system involved in Fe-S cluster assembly, permease component n=1 Tax=Archaeoglobus sulfaticallidus PM70-1 TaxID=387631 RepID=N0BGJ5_9EURY|nr:SufD family Fe-S cluster assembly protein [Archaeoglobus sulfaticallidus]AGK61412.1 ABC-type transport system involved in Fe-S cluster assembly, permease component [Archaeoglobus sulfaticallidus PM70-1]